MSPKDKMFMRRCIELAKKSGSAVKSNPNVGALLVHDNRIIGEGCHEFFGGPHAEVNAFNNVMPQDKSLIPKATLYVTLEPCCTVGKTPACTDAILSNGLKKVVISVSDPNKNVDGQSVQLLRKKGVHVTTGVLEKSGRELIRPFIANLASRPYVILKWAQSCDGYIGKKGKQVWLSNKAVKLKSHIWRSQVDAILIGHNTAMSDDPSLTTRLVEGHNPIRILLSNDISELREKTIFTDEIPLMVYGAGKDQNLGPGKSYHHFDFDTQPMHEFLSLVYSQGINRLLVEGGSKTHKQFITRKLWNEARVIRTPVILKSGIKAPHLDSSSFSQELIYDNLIEYVYS